jgi:hypothetical protein
MLQQNHSTGKELFEFALMYILLKMIETRKKGVNKANQSSSADIVYAPSKRIIDLSYLAVLLIRLQIQ